MPVIERLKAAKEVMPLLSLNKLIAVILKHIACSMTGTIDVK